jgi:hypothetical protein
MLFHFDLSWPSLKTTEWPQIIYLEIVVLQYRVTNLSLSGQSTTMNQLSGVSLQHHRFPSLPIHHQISYFNHTKTYPRILLKRQLWFNLLTSILHNRFTNISPKALTNIVILIFLSSLLIKPSNHRSSNRCIPPIFFTTLIKLFL